MDLYPSALNSLFRNEWHYPYLLMLPVRVLWRCVQQSGCPRLRWREHQNAERTLKLYTQLWPGVCHMPALSEWKGQTQKKVSLKQLDFYHFNQSGLITTSYHSQRPFGTVFIYLTCSTMKWCIKGIQLVFWFKINHIKVSSKWWVHATKNIQEIIGGKNITHWINNVS